jgi:hypothetical protein
MRSILAFLAALICGVPSTSSAAKLPVPATFRLTAACGIPQDTALEPNFAVTACTGSATEIAAVMPSDGLSGHRIYLAAQFALHSRDTVNAVVLITSYQTDKIVSHAGGNYLVTNNRLSASAYIPMQADKVAIFIQLTNEPTRFNITSIDLRKSSGGFDPGAMSPAAQAYLERAFEKIEKNFLFYGSAQLDEIKRKTLLNASGSVEIGELALSMKDAARLLGDPHSGFYTADEIQVLGRETSGPPSAERPAENSVQGRMLGPSLAYIKLFRRSAIDRDARTRYAVQIRRLLVDLYGQGARRWIIDLRDQQGGSTGPLIAGFRPLYGNADVGFTVDRVGHRSRWAFGIAGDADDSEPYFSASSPTFAGEGAPVALLIGNRTASAGEALLTAFLKRPLSATFGARTAGFTTSVHDRP